MESTQNSDKEMLMPSAWLPARLLACSPDTDKEIFCVSLLKTVLPFLTNQAA